MIVISDSMDLDIIEKIFTIAGSIAGFLALFLLYRDYRKKEPNLSGYLLKANYKVDSQGIVQSINLNASFMISNTGYSPTSISNSAAIIRLHPEITKYQRYNAIQGKTINENVPCDIKANGTTKVDLSYIFEVDNPDFLDRCLVPMNIRNPQHIEQRDLPLAVHFFIKHTYGQLDIKGCVYRKDQPESEKSFGEQGLLFFSEAEVYDKNSKPIIME